MAETFKLPVVEEDESLKKLRYEVREFVREEREKGTFETNVDTWLSGFNAEFSQKLGERGWIGVSLPKKYGGSDRGPLERYVITEELLVTGAPVSAHWVADRQTAPLLLRYGTEEQRQKFLPEICKGRCYFSIGLSEPNAGSDLAALSTRAEKKGDKFILNGSKIWTSGAHLQHYMIVLCRTSPRTENKHAGMSQLIVDLSAPGVTIRPIKLMTGEHHFNEVFFENVEIPENMLVGELGNGWRQGMAELAFERSGPERFLSTYPLLNEVLNIVRERKDLSHGTRREIGKFVSDLWALRKMSIGVAKLLERGETPNTLASLVKDLGTKFENDIIELARRLIDTEPSIESRSRYEMLLARSILHSPGFTLRGGTTEILRSIVSRGLGV